MRHLWSLLAGIVAAPLAWLGLATGQHRSAATVAGWQSSGQFDTADLVGPVIFLVVAGILLGVVGTLRWSPAGPLAAGVLLVIPTIFMFINPFETLDAFSYDETNRFLGQDLQLWLPVQNGTLLVLGALLLVAGFSMQRWRDWPRLPEPVRYPSDGEVVAGVAALGGSAGSGSAMSDDEIVAAAAALDDQTARTGQDQAQDQDQDQAHQDQDQAHQDQDQDQAQDQDQDQARDQSHDPAGEAGTPPEPRTDGEGTRGSG